MGDTVLTVKCADGKVYKVTAKLAEFSRRLIGALNDPRNRGCDEITIILDQQVNGNIFELLLIWAQHYMNAQEAVEKEAHGGQSPSSTWIELANWDTEFFKTNWYALNDMVKAAEYLGMKDFLRMVEIAKAMLEEVCDEDGNHVDE